MKIRVHERWHYRCGLLAVAIGCVSMMTAASAQEPLAEAKASYANAAYEDALKLLSPLETPEAMQYKALCYLALGRNVEATRTIEAIVNVAPMFSPSEADAPPRFRTLVTDTRRKMLPTIARRAFTEGRERFTAKASEEARQRFEVVMALTSDPLFKDSPEAKDLRTLAEGFIDLTKATTTTAKAPEPAAPVAAVARVDPPKLARSEVTTPTVIRQDIPPFPANLLSTASPVAMVRITIGADGTVTSATIERSAHVVYDRALLRAANSWLYKPATLNGVPVATDKVVTVQVR